MITRKKPVLFLLLLFAGTVVGDVKAQACGYSINTIYLKDQLGNSVNDASIVVTMKDPKDDYNPHFTEASRTYWDIEHGAYVYQHGLCGDHRQLQIRISAPGFSELNHAFNLPLGSWGYTVKLKREGTNERPTFELLSCASSSNACVRRPYL